MRTTALTIILTLALATAAAAQERSFELGGGWFQWNPLDVGDLVSFPSGPSATVAWTLWNDERRQGWVVGTTTVLAKVQPECSSSESYLPVYPHMAWRWRWELDDGSDLVFGAGGGPLFWGSKRVVDYSWDPVRRITVATDVDGPHEARIGFLYHLEVSGIRPIRDGLKVRYGVAVTPLLWVPLAVQPMVSGVWDF